MSATLGGRFSETRSATARLVVVVELLLQAALIVISVLQNGLGQFVKEIAAGNTTSALGLVFPVVFLVLVYPIARGSRWALVSGTLLLLLLTIAGQAAFRYAFPRRADLVSWAVLSAIFLTALVGIGLGVIAILEAFGRASPDHFRSPGGGLTYQGVALVAVAGAALGATILAVAISQQPSVGTTLPQAPDQVLQVPIETNTFVPSTLELKAGEATAIFLANRDAIGHSFDVDSLNVHVVVPPGTTAVAMVKLTASGQVPYYCGVPGHREIGMVGTLNVH